MTREFNRTKGAVTVEACIAFPIFLCFFLLLIFLVRLICADMVLQHTANETAKQLSAAAYPVKFINELEDDVFLDKENYSTPSFTEELQKAKSYIADNMETDTANIISMLLTGSISGEITNPDPSKAIEEISDKALKDLKSGVRTYITKQFGSDYYELKNKLKYTAVKTISEKYFEGTYLDKNKMEIILVQLPQSLAEYGIRSRDTVYKKICDDIGYIPDRDDVVIALRYEVKIPVPLFNNRTIILEHAAVERAWINGSNGVFSKDFDNAIEDSASDNDPADVEDNYRRQLEETVYITNTGTKYHKPDCPCLSSSKKPLKLSDAKEMGYKECRVCSNKGKWNFYK
jgi:hypothetical protein